MDKTSCLTAGKEDVLKQSSKNHAIGTAALYCRLSRDDNMDTESNSISNRKKILLKAAKEMDIDHFLEAVRRYTNATAITQRMVAELIDHIDVYHAEKQDGVTTQRVDIHYNCIGVFDVPDRRKIPEADITMRTRKGVAVSYAPAQIAV